MAASKTKLVPQPRSAMDFAWMKQVTQLLNALRNGQVTNGFVHYSDSNTIWDMTAGGSATIQMFAITTLSSADYLMAKTWDGSALGASEIAIAKSPRMRPSVESELIDGVTINYTYTDDNNRTADDGTNTEAQVVFPRFTTLADLGLDKPDALSNCQAIIFAVQAKTGIVDVDNKAVEWIELQPARVWARRYLQ